MEEYKYFNELSGPPNGGKHTLTGRLIRGFFALGRQDVDSLQADRDIPAGLAQPAKHFDREMFILSKIVNLIIYAQNVLRAKIFFVHRGPYDAIAWFRALVTAGLISKKEAAPGIFYAKANIYRIDRVILVKVPVEVSLARSLGLSTKDDLARDIIFLRALFQAYEELEKELPKGSLIIDGTLPVEENVDIISKATSLLWSNPGISKELIFNTS